MLQLKRVEIQGFKSFCDRTELRFNGTGIAAVVGPNGCGKSNLSDAISWVLGEQSAKSLRGTRMEDVIFAGTRDRKPLGMASVTMTLVDPVASGQIPSDLPKEPGGDGKHPSEVTITRRLYRSGESEYLIDGRAARLRDIQELFMGTGLGPESYAIIEQGRIGQILSSKPQDRRSIIEEAAGITKYKTKRRLSEGKLESAKQNLSRVFDILEEVTRQLNSLKRQAAKAKRYGELKAEMDGKLRLVLAGRFQAMNGQEHAVAEQKEAAALEFDERTGQLTGKEDEHARLQTACFEVERQLTETRARLSELNIEMERAKGRLDSQARQSAAIDQRITQGEAEAQQLEAGLTALEAEIAAQRETLLQVESQTTDARERSLAANEEREVLQNRVRDREKALETGRVAVLRLLGEASTLKNQLAQIDEYLAGIERETARARREEEVAAGDLERLEKAKEEMSHTLSRQQMQLESIQDQRRLLEEDLATHRQMAQNSRRQVEQLRGETSQLKARKESLEGIISHRSYTTESVKRVFEAIERSAVDDFKPLGVLADFVEVDRTYERAAEEFLHEELEYIVVPNWNHAERGVDLVRSDLDGRATFLVHPDSNGSHDLPDRALPEPAIGPETGIVARLSDGLRLVNGLKDRAQDLLPRLTTCFLAEDRAAAQRLSAQYPHLYFLLPDGVCYHGYALSGGTKKGSGPLGLKRELREVTSAADLKQRDLDEQTRRLAELDAQIALLSEDLEKLRQSQQSCEKDAVALTSEMRKLTEELARVNSRLSVARVELERLRQEKERSTTERHKNHLLLEEKEQLRGKQEGELETARQQLEEFEAEFARAQEEHAVVRVRLAGLEERLRAERLSQGRLDAQWKEGTQRRQYLVREMERLGVDRARLLADNIELDRRIATLSEEALETECEVTRMAAGETETRANLTAAEEAIKLIRGQVDEVRERRTQLEVALVQLRADLKYLDETSRKELGVAVADLLAQVTQPESAEGEAPVPFELTAELLEEAEQSHQEIKGRIESMGPVNPQALEEFQETQQRFDFLNAQRQDLLDSIRDTEKAIQEIDLVSRQRFNEAFEAINDHFRQTFQILFGGGTGEMRLTDAENAFESGIDIVAQPPGKKLQNMLLLSGGEKALTAMALLMGIFRYQPSPFCVLDEVDAPLDEANIGRFTKLVKEMSFETQFVIITHSKKTMESAQSMYGVTMQEPGVSKLVSVKFNAIAPNGNGNGVKAAPAR
ncbi:MAG: chromosome segregation protein SMC [Bryobacteraceae bacterium]